jgi:hypothetical protein
MDYKLYFLHAIWDKMEMTSPCSYQIITNMTMVKNEITYHIKHIIIASFLNNKFLELHFANWILCSSTNKSVKVVV